MQSPQELEEEAIKSKVAKELLKMLKKTKALDKPFLNKEHIQDNYNNILAIESKLNGVQDLIDKVNKQ